MRDTLLQQFPGVWRADASVFGRTVIPSGHAALDLALGGGWPQPALLEFFCDQPGIGELQLLLPLLQRCSQRVGDDEPAQTFWLNPPFVLHSVALQQCGIDPSRQWLATGLKPRDVGWAMEQALRSGACALVIAWVERLSLPSLRRLKLATSAGHCCGVLFRPAREARELSPANVRVLLETANACLQIRLLKVQGRLPGIVQLDLQARAGIGKDANDVDS